MEERVALLKEMVLELDRTTTESAGQRARRGYLLAELAATCALPKRHREALQAAAEQLAIMQEIGDRGVEGGALNVLGAVCGAVGEPARAIESYEQALAIARELGDRPGEAHALYNGAFALDELGDRVQAIARLRAALEIEEAIKCPTAGKTHAKLAEWGGEGFG